MACAVILVALAGAAVAGVMIANRKSRSFVIPLVLGLAANAYAFKIGDEGLIGGLTLMAFSLFFFASWALRRAAIARSSGDRGVA